MIIDLLETVFTEGFGTLGTESGELGDVLADEACEVLRGTGLLSAGLHISI